MYRSITPRRARPMAASLVALAALAACGGHDEAFDADATYAATIRRTAYGVPHISARDEKGLGYGVGYAYAEDNVCLMAETLVTLQGQRSRHFGGDASYDAGGLTLPNLLSDLYYTLVNDDERVQADWARQSAEVQALARGYAAGYNRYLRDTGRDRLPAACRNQPWVREMTTRDLVRLQRHFTLAEGSMGVLLTALARVQPPGAGATVRPPAAAGSAARLGSNAIALGRDATASGAGLLLANPHFPWSSVARFYQLHLTIPGKLDVMGASLGGLPVVNIGFNAALAWSHTVTESRHHTRVAITLDPQDPWRYQVDGQWHRLQKKTLSIAVRNAAGQIETRSFDHYFSEHGPVIEWGREQAIAWRDANADNDRLIQQWWAMNRAGSLAEFRGALERIVGAPWVQTLAVDRSGQAWYGNITPVPLLSAATLARCVPAAFTPDLAYGEVVLDGNRGDCGWEQAAGTPQPGITPGAQLPSLLRSDYVQNSNDSAWLTHAQQRLTGFAPHVSREAYAQNGRTRLGLAFIADRLAGRDGLPGRRFDRATLQTLAFSNRSLSADTLRPGLVQACAGGGTAAAADGTAVDLAPACAVLAAWDGRAELDSVGWPLFEAWLELMREQDDDYWVTPFDAADPVATPRGLRVDDPAVRERARRTLAQAVQQLRAEGVALSAPWRDVQATWVGEQRIAIHGGGSEDVYNAIDARSLGNGRRQVIAGSSFVMTVSFDGGAPTAQGFLSYSQSTDPASPHATDQTRAFADKRWLPLPFREAEIAADPALTTRRISE